MIEAGSPGDGGTSGEGGEPGIVGEGGMGGEGGMLACFGEPSWIGGAGAPDSEGVTAQPNDTGGVHVGVSCDALKSRFAVAYDVIGKQVSLDLSSIAPVRKATYTFDASYSNGEGSSVDCFHSTVQPVGSKLVIPVGSVQNPFQFRLTALELEDECGSDLTLENQGNSETCFNLTVHEDGGDWAVDCYEGSCFPTCNTF